MGSGYIRYYKWVRCELGEWGVGGGWVWGVWGVEICDHMCFCDAILGDKGVWLKLEKGRKSIK